MSLSSCVITIKSYTDKVQEEKSVYCDKVKGHLLSVLFHGIHMQRKNKTAMK